MADLTEQEIFSCLVENFHQSADYCDRLSRGERGPIYPLLVSSLKLVEGASRQAAVWREDARWLMIATHVNKAHQRCGDWLRNKAKSIKFAQLADFLRKGEMAALELQTKRTGRRGPILPLPQRPTEIRQGRPVPILLPPGFVDGRKTGESVH